MHYYYRSHITAHILKNREKQKRKKKRVIWFSAGILVFLVLPVAWAAIQRDARVAGEDPAPGKTVLQTADEASVAVFPAEGDPQDVQRAKAAAANPAVRDPWELHFSSHLEEKILRVSRGETLITILIASGVETTVAYRAVNALEAVFDPRKLRAGNKLRITFDKTNNEQDPLFRGFCLELGPDREVQLIDSKDQGRMMVREFRRDLEARPVIARARINSSLYQAAVDADLPVDVLMRVIRAYSYDVDFQRDIRSGDRIGILYEEKADKGGLAIKSGKVLYASLETGGRVLPIYYYETKDGESGFFDPGGESVRKTLMLTPVDGARLSSGYGMRRHPIRGYNRMHKGLDFAAPTGTPVMAAGDGVVEYAGRKGSYGHYIRIRHPNQYHTVYAHLSRYAGGVKRGARVEQGKIIGYVGSTGESTGPHLHYEVHHRGEHVNPAAVKSPPGRTLEGEELKRFYLAKNRLQSLYASLAENVELAGKPVAADEKPAKEEKESG